MDTAPLTRDHQQRFVRLERSVLDPGKEGRVKARVLTYGSVDTYGTTFARGVFNESMNDRMPRIVWSHDWADVIGVWESYEEDDEGLTLIGQLDDFDAVPRARQAWAQLQSGSIDQFSVGFWPQDFREVVVNGETVIEFTRGTLDEASLVMVGAVPGTKLLSLRDKRATVADNLERAVEAAMALQEELRSEDLERTMVEDAPVDELTDEEADLADDIVEVTDDDLTSWAALADEGDDEAAAALGSALDWLFPDVNRDDYADWASCIESALSVDLSDEQPESAAVVQTDVDAIADESADDGWDEELAAMLEADIAAALATLHDIK